MQANPAETINSQAIIQTPLKEVPPHIETREEWVQRLQDRKLHKPGEALMQEAEEISLLTFADEVRLGKLVQKGDIESRNILVTANMRLAGMMAQRFSKDKNEFEDLLHEGITALFKAAESYDPDRGLRFSTLAGMVIIQELKRYRAKMGRTIALPEERHAMIGASYKVEDELVQKLGRMVTPEEISPHLGVEHLREGDKKNDFRDAAYIRLVTEIGKGSVSLNQRMGNDPQSDTFQDNLADDTENTSEQALAQVESSMLWRAMDQLNNEEAQIIIKTFGLLGEHLTLPQMSQELGIDEKMLRKKRDRALKKLRLAAQNEGLGI